MYFVFFSISFTCRCPVSRFIFLNKMYIDLKCVHFYSGIVVTGFIVMKFFCPLYVHFSFQYLFSIVVFLWPCLSSLVSIWSLGYHKILPLVIVRTGFVIVLHLYVPLFLLINMTTLWPPNTVLFADSHIKMLSQLR